jgi:hypothetical protein
MNEVGRHVREQYADTAGFTDHLFGASSLLGYNRSANQGSAIEAVVRI